MKRTKTTPNTPFSASHHSGRKTANLLTGQGSDWAKQGLHRPRPTRFPRPSPPRPRRPTTLQLSAAHGFLFGFWKKIQTTLPRRCDQCCPISCLRTGRVRARGGAGLSCFGGHDGPADGVAASGRSPSGRRRRVARRGHTSYLVDDPHRSRGWDGGGAGRASRQIEKGGRH